MTEAMSRHEIEDVLSSIRRLVSHEDRSPQVSAPPASAAPAKLVLTSALRVDGPDAQDDSTSNHAEAPEALPTPSPAFADAPVRAPLLTRIAQAGQATAAASNEQTPPSDASQPAGAASDPQAPMEDAVTDTVLEATLARLEEALSITPSKPDSPATADAVIDEAALAQIVSQIVRQELQGELGERITRNIRKLVRAEVARELQMRNL